MTMMTLMMINAQLVKLRNCLNCGEWTKIADTIVRRLLSHCSPAAFESQLSAALLFFVERPNEHAVATPLHSRDIVSSASNSIVPIDCRSSRDE